MLRARPALPTIRIHFGSWTCTSQNIVSIDQRVKYSLKDLLSRAMLTNLSMACTKILTPSARRNTPLKKAPNIVALCQP